MNDAQTLITTLQSAPPRGFHFSLGENELNAIKDYNHQARTVQ